MLCRNTIPQGAVGQGLSVERGVASERTCVRGQVTRTLLPSEIKSRQTIKMEECFTSASFRFQIFNETMPFE